MQLLQNELGAATGVFIPIKEWSIMKSNYPDIDALESELPNWQKIIIDERLKDIENNPASLRPISELFDILEKEI
jgi:Putative addiction module component